MESIEAVKVPRILRRSNLRKFSLWGVFLLLTYIVVLLKFLNIRNQNESIFLTVYSLTVSVYILSRFLISHFYLTDRLTDDQYQPTISFGVPAKNEEGVIAETILKIAELDYPKEKIEIICVNDGSTDNTLREMRKGQQKAKKLGVKVHVANWRINKGKREGMAYCARLAKNDIVVFIDSDSLVDNQAARELVRFMADPSVAAVTAHTFVANENVNILTKMQAIRYFVAFRAYKGAESIFGTVTCCSGPCSAYRREYLMAVLDQWVNQRFLKTRCTYGDDRSLTNALLEKGYKTIYSPKAKVYTFVPEDFKQYLKQQLRWKKSWTRECLRATKFMWRKNPIMSISFYLGLILPLIAPYIVLRAFVYYPLVNARLPYYYFLGVIIMTLIFGLYYMIYGQDRHWLKASFFSMMFSIVFFWQLPYAILTIRDSSWGTR